MFLNVFIVTFVGIAAHNAENYQENRGLSGVHLKVAIYHVSWKRSSWLAYFYLLREKNVHCSLFILFNLKEPPVFSIIRDPTNSSVVNYIGFPKIVFDLLAASQNFTFVDCIF